MKIKHLALALVAAAAFASHVALAATPAPGTSWVKGVGASGNIEWFSASKVATGKGIWDSVPRAATSGGGASLTGTTKLAVGAGQIAVVAKGVVTSASVYATFKAATGGPLGLALMVAPPIISWLASGNVRYKPQGTPLEFEKRDRDGQTEYQTPDGSWVSGPAAGCSAAAAEVSRNVAPDTATVVGITQQGPLSVLCLIDIKDKTGEVVGSSNQALSGRVSTALGPWEPATVDGIAPNLEGLPTPDGAIDFMSDNSLDFKLDNPSITGPATVSGLPTVSTVNNGTTTQTSNTTQKSTNTYGTGVSPETGDTVSKVTSSTSNVTVNVTTNNSPGAVTNTTTTTVTTPAAPSPATPVTPTDPAAEPQEIETCGLPGKPACAIDEKDTPAPVPVTQYESSLDDYKTKQQELKDKVSGVDDKSFFSGWGDVFVTPPLAACTGYELPREMGIIDPCPVVDGVRTIMAYIWALTALFLAVGMVKKVI
jgi:hypothetical protein